MSACATEDESISIQLIPFELPDLPVNDLSFVLSAEAAAAFDDTTRSNCDDRMVRQIKNAWPNVCRAIRFIPAVEYVQANRLRTLLIRQMAEKMKSANVFLAPSFDGGTLTLTNLMGHPCVVLPNGFQANGAPTSITFIGHLFGEADLLTAAKSYQQATGFHQRHPKL